MPKIFKTVVIYSKYNAILFAACNGTIQDALNGYRAYWGSMSEDALVDNLGYIIAT